MKILKSLFLLIILVCSAACHTEDRQKSPCDAGKPLEELEWLKKRKEVIIGAKQKGRIIMTAYKNEPVFYVNDCYECADALTLVYNCEGKVICEFGGIDGRDTCPDFSLGKDDRILFDNTAPKDNK